jgi:hypothetical protein
MFFGLVTVGLPAPHLKSGREAVDRVRIEIPGAVTRQHVPALGMVYYLRLNSFVFFDPLPLSPYYELRGEVACGACEFSDFPSSNPPSLSTM